MRNRAKLNFSGAAVFFAATAFLSFVTATSAAGAGGGYPNPRLAPLVNVSLVVSCPPTVKAGQTLQLKIALVNNVKIAPTLFQMAFFRGYDLVSSQGVSVKPVGQLIKFNNYAEWKVPALKAGLHVFTLTMKVPSARKSPATGQLDSLHILTMVTLQSNLQVGDMQAVDMKYVK